MKNDIEQAILYAKKNLYLYVDRQKNIDDMERTELLLNLGMNLLCQLIVESAMPDHSFIKRGFNEIIGDMSIWRDCYLKDNPQKSGMDLLKEISNRMKN